MPPALPGECIQSRCRALCTLLPRMWLDDTYKEVVTRIRSARLAIHKVAGSAFGGADDERLLSLAEALFSTTCTSLRFVMFVHSSVYHPLMYGLNIDRPALVGCLSCYFRSQPVKSFLKSRRQAGPSA